MRRIDRVAELWRFYQAGVVNTLFGFGLYALLVRAGLNMYAAQIVAHVAGVMFNYLTYSRHVFRDSGPAKTRFAASYTVNYLLSVAALALVSIGVRSPYLAGAIATVAVSVVNYFALKHLVFTRRPARGPAR